MTSNVVPLPSGPVPTGPVGRLAEAGLLVDEVGQTLWAAQSGETTVEAFHTLQALKAKIDAVELGLLREIEATGAAQQAGWASVKDFATDATGGKRGAGPAALRLATTITAFPDVEAALAAGWLSRTKATIIVGAVERLPGDRDLRHRAVQVLLAEARVLGATDLDRAARHVLEVIDPDGVEARLERELAAADRAAHLHRSLSIRFDRLGGGHGEFTGAAEDLLLIKTALLAKAHPEPAEAGACGGPGTCSDPGCLRRGHDGRDPRDHGTRMFDALVELVREAQARGDLPECHGGIPRLVVTMDLHDLRETLGEAGTDLDETLPAGTVRRLACDAEVIPAVLGTDSTIQDVGHTVRLVTAAIWIALVLRDRHCTFPGCRRPPIMCHAHHILHWIDGGPTSLDNLALLCGTHHRMIHNTPWQIRLGKDRRPEFLPPPHLRTNPDTEEWIRQRGSPRD